jgi:hypothetical protein
MDVDCDASARASMGHRAISSSGSFALFKPFSALSRTARGFE